jgi:Family of unknown function (DUF6069)
MVVAFVIGVVDSLVIWAIAALFGVDILLPEAPGSDSLAPITLLPVVVVVAIAATAAGSSLWVLERFAPARALGTFVSVALIALAASLVLPLALDQSAEGRLALVAMHLLVGSAIIGTFVWVGTRRLRVQQTVER